MDIQYFDMKICVLLTVVSSCKVCVISVANDCLLILPWFHKLLVVFFTILVGVVCGLLPLANTNDPCCSHVLSKTTLISQSSTLPPFYCSSAVMHVHKHTKKSI